MENGLVDEWSVKPSYFLISFVLYVYHTHHLDDLHCKKIEKKKKIVSKYMMVLCLPAKMAFYIDCIAFLNTQLDTISLN